MSSPDYIKLKARWSRQYPPLRDKFLDENEVCCRCQQTIPRYLRTLHHWAGRLRELLIWLPGFRMACRDCHRWIEGHRKKASELGFRAPEAIFGRPSKVIPKWPDSQLEYAGGKMVSR